MLATQYTTTCNARRRMSLDEILDFDLFLAEGFYYEITGTPLNNEIESIHIAVIRGLL